ncbi:MAG: YCF48-related protein [Bacillota bacterium]|nr:YCF48-related protein [Bacillota bacterium]
MTPKPEGAGAQEISWSGFFLDLRTAWVLRTPADPTEPDVLYRTTDGGRNWTANRLGVGGVADIRFVGSLTGWMLVHRNGAAGSELVSVLKSTDGGASWTEIARTEPVGRTNPGSAILDGRKTGVASADARHVWVTGSWAGPGVLLYRSADGGKTWSRQAIPVPAGFDADGGSGVSYPPVFAAPQEGVLPVVYTGQGFVLYRTSDGGRTWTPSTPVRFRAAEPFPAFGIVDTGHVVVTDGVDIYRTDDGGRTWTTIHPQTSLEGVKELGFVDPSWGWALVPGPQGTESGTTLWITRDGGRTWATPDGPER